MAHQGFYFDVWLDVAGLRLHAVWDKHFVCEHHLGPGTRVDIGFYAHKVHVLPESDG
jgi:hypothetical protein